MNKARLKNRLVFKNLVQKKLSDPGGLKHRRDTNYVPPDSVTSGENDFSDIFNIDEELGEIQPSNNLYNEVYQDKKDDDK